MWGRPGVFPPSPTLACPEQERGRQRARLGGGAPISDRGVHVWCSRQWGPLPALSLLLGEVTHVLCFHGCVSVPSHPSPPAGLTPPALALCVCVCCAGGGGVPGSCWVGPCRSLGGSSRPRGWALPGSGPLRVLSGQVSGSPVGPGTAAWPASAASARCVGSCTLLLGPAVSCQAPECGGRASDCNDVTWGVQRKPEGLEWGWGWPGAALAFPQHVDGKGRWSCGKRLCRAVRLWAWGRPPHVPSAAPHPVAPMTLQ